MPFFLWTGFWYFRTCLAFSVIVVKSKTLACITFPTSTPQRDSVSGLVKVPLRVNRGPNSVGVLCLQAPVDGFGLRDFGSARSLACPLNLPQPTLGAERLEAWLVALPWLSMSLAFSLWVGHWSNSSCRTR